MITLLISCNRRRNTTEMPSDQGPSPSISPSTPLFSPITAQSSIKSVRSRLKQEFEARSSELKDVAKLHAAWNEAWQPTFELPLKSAESRDVASGLVLPPEILGHLNDAMTAAELFATDQASFAKDRKEFEAAYALTLIASALCTRGGAELPAFANRAVRYRPQLVT